MTRRDTIVWVLSMYEPSWGWLSYGSGRLAVQEFGRDAGTVVLELLEDVQLTAQNRPRTWTSLEVSSYEASGFPIERLIDLASGRDTVHADQNLNYGFRLKALRALASRPRPELAAYWIPLLSDRHPEVRQAAAGGLACATGVAALDTLRHLAQTDAHADVRTTAAYAVEQLVTSGDAARVCHGGLGTRDDAARMELPIDPALRAQARRRFGFRR